MQPKGVFGSLVRKNLSRYWLLSLVVFIILSSFAFRSLELLWSYSDQEGMSLLLEEEKEAVSSDFRIIWERHFKSMDSLGLLELLSSNFAVFCIFSYLHKKKRDHFFQSLPVKRDSLFLSSLVSGLLVYVLPWLVVTALSAPVLFFTATEFPFALGMYLQALLLQLVLYLASYSISLLAAVLCGRRFFAVFLMILLHSLLPMLESYFVLILRDNLYGLSMGQRTFTDISFAYLIELFCYNYNAPFPWGVLGIYAGFSLLLIGLSFFLHRKRREEYVGQNLVFPSLLLWAQTLVALFIAYTGAELFVDFEILPVKDENFAYLCLFLFPFALILSRMLLLRSRKVFRKKAILQYAALTLCFSAVVLSCRFDLLGIVRKVPEAEDVQRLRIELNDLCFIAEEREDIEDFLPIHRMLIENRHDLIYTPAPYGYSLDDVRTLKLTYEREGMDLVRTYSLVYFNARYDFVLDALETYFMENDRSVKYILQLQKETEYATFTQGSEDLIFARFTLSSTQTEALFQALIQDMKEGNQALILQDYSYSFSKLTLSKPNGDSYRLCLPRDLKHTLRLLKEFQAEYNATLDP